MQIDDYPTKEDKELMWDMDVTTFYTKFINKRVNGIGKAIVLEVKLS